MNLRYFTSLLRDEDRLRAMVTAIRAAVRPGDRVLDIGTGLGTFAFAAVEAGASEVVAIDHDPVVHLAEELARRNGTGDRIRFVRGSYPEVDPGGPFDVAIFEDYVAGLMTAELHEMLDVGLRRDLRPDGRLVPGRARLHLAPVLASDCDSLVRTGTNDGWLEEIRLDGPFLRLRLGSLTEKFDLGPGALAGLPWDGPSIHLNPPPGPRELEIAASWEVATEEWIGGLAVWMTLEPVGAPAISNAPGADGPWRQWLLPVDPAIHVVPGDRLEARVARDPDPAGRPRWARWQVRTPREQVFRHEFGGLLMGPEMLQSALDAARAELDADAGAGPDATGVPPRDAGGRGG